MDIRHWSVCRHEPYFLYSWDPLNQLTSGNLRLVSVHVDWTIIYLHYSCFCCVVCCLERIVLTIRRIHIVYGRVEQAVGAVLVFKESGLFIMGTKLRQWLLKVTCVWPLSVRLTQCCFFFSWAGRYGVICCSATTWTLSMIGEPAFWFIFVCCSSLHSFNYNKELNWAEYQLQVTFSHQGWS